MAKIRKIVLLVFALFLLFVCLVLATQTYLNESTGWEQGLSAVHFASLALADIDNDGDIDLTSIGRYDVFKSKIYINNGSSLEENSTWQQNLTNIHYGAIAWADIDNNGRIDLIAMGCVSGGGLASTCDTRAIFVYINNGISLVDNITWKENLNPIWNGGIATGDINNDGWLDLLVTGNSNSGRMSKIYLNNGTSFTESNAWEQNLLALWKSVGQFGDIDNDRDLDLILLGDQGVNSGTAKVYLNNGTSFEENSTWQQNIGGEYHASISLGDYDDDGDLDLTAIGKTSTDHHRIYRNDITTFTLVELEYELGDLVGVYRGSVGWVDYNNSGYLDVMSTGYESHTTLNKNVGGDFLSALADPESHIPNLEFGSSFVWGDLDNDTDLDLVITGYEESLAYDIIRVYMSNVSDYKNNSLPTPSSNFSNYSLVNGNIFLGWNNGSDTETISNGLYYNLRVGTTSGGNQIVSGVYGGSSNPYGGYFGNMMQRRNISLAGTRFQVGTTYYWSVQTIDTGLAKSTWSAEQTFTLTSDFTPPVVTLNAPSGVTNQTLNIVFNASVYDDYNLTNVSLYGNWSGWHLNVTNSSGINNTNYIFKANLSEGEWLWGIRACDATSNCRGVNSTFRIDITYPIVALVSPANGTSQTSSNSVTFSYNVSDVAINNCTLYLNGTANETDTSITVSTAQTFTENVPNGAYNWSVRCADAANNINTSGNYSLTISYTPSETPASTSGGGGGSGGGGAVSAAVTKVTRIIASIAEGNNLIEFAESEKAAIGIEEIMLDSAAAVSNVKLTIEKLTAMPASVSTSPSGDVYSYLQFNKTVLKDEDVKEAKIKFRVDKAWIAKNAFDMNKVALNRYKTAWEALPTRYIRQNGSYYYYESTTPGFSVFAITAERQEIPAPMKEVNATEPEKEEAPVQEPQKAEEKEEQKSLWRWYAVGALLAAALIASALMMRKAKNSHRK